MRYRSLIARLLAFAPRRLPGALWLRRPRSHRYSCSPRCLPIQRDRTKSRSLSRLTYGSAYGPRSSSRPRRSSVALGAPAHRARLVQERAHPASAREDEGLERLQILLALVHEPLERAHVVGTDFEHARVLGVRRRRQLAAEVEQLVLDPFEDLLEPVARGARRRVGVEAARQTDDGVELVDLAVALDAGRVLRHARAADQGGRPLVAGAGVDARDTDGHGYERRTLAPSHARSGPLPREHFCERGRDREGAGGDGSLIPYSP